jgi:hypothetical protein
MSLLDSRTATIFLLSKNGTKYYYNTLKESITLRTGETISNLSYFISLDDDTFDDGFNLILNSKNVDNNIKNQFKLINQKREKQKSTLYNDKEIENEALKAAVLTQIDSQEALWKNINSEDPNFLEKVQDYNIEQKGLREESMLKNQFNTQVSNYYQNSSDYYNSLKLNHKNEYIKDVQDEKILQDIRKNEMLVSDIMTKEREIQLARYAYFQKKRVNQYVNILILISGLCIIILAIGKIKPDLNKFIIIICLTVVLLLGLIIIIGNLVRDSRRYSLDYDEINFKPWNKPK